MKKSHIILIVAIIIVILLAYGIFDLVIGGIGSIHTTQFVLDLSSSDTSTESNQTKSENRELILKQVRAIAEAHNFKDLTLNIAGEPRPIVYFETLPPWPCIIRVFETDEELSIDLWQYNNKRNQTNLYKEVKVALEKELKKNFAGRLNILSQRELRYPWQSD